MLVHGQAHQDRDHLRAELVRIVTRIQPLGQPLHTLGAVEETRGLPHRRQPLVPDRGWRVRKDLSGDHRELVRGEQRAVRQLEIQQPIIPQRRLRARHVHQEPGIGLLPGHAVTQIEGSVFDLHQCHRLQHRHGRVGADQAVHVIGILAVLVMPEHDTALLAGPFESGSQQLRHTIQLAHQTPPIQRNNSCTNIHGRVKLFPHLAGSWERPGSSHPAHTMTG